MFLVFQTWLPLPLFALWNCFNACVLLLNFFIAVNFFPTILTKYQIYFRLKITFFSFSFFSFYYKKKFVQYLFVSIFPGYLITPRRWSRPFHSSYSFCRSLSAWARRIKDSSRFQTSTWYEKLSKLFENWNIFLNVNSSKRICVCEFDSTVKTYVESFSLVLFMFYQQWECEKEYQTLFAEKLNYITIIFSGPWLLTRQQGGQHVSQL